MLPKPVRFAAAIGILGLVMFNIPPKAAVALGAILVLGALVSSGPNPSQPIKEFGNLLYGG